jgi:hypothetical protein
MLRLVAEKPLRARASKSPAMLPTSGAVTDFRGVDMTHHSSRTPFQQDVICTAIGCKADVDPRFHPSMTCLKHAIKLHAAVEANKQFLQGWMKNIAEAERPDLKPIPKKYLVYYIRFGDGIKIGTTHNLAQRLSSFCVPAAAVLAVEPGGFELERSRHEFFADSRIGRTEVFQDSPKLQRHIEAVKKYHGEPRVTGPEGLRPVRT